MTASQESTAAASGNWRVTDIASARLVEDARRAAGIAATHCRECRWYHACWTWWRALGLASGADLHRGFFRDAINDVVAPRGGNGLRVLLSGSGDSALLAAAVDALGASAAAADVHVLDRCETPLELCRDLAGLTGLHIRTHACDILEFDREGGFDVILVHAFLGFFEPRQRPALFRCWFERLAPGGRLIMVQRLRPRARPAVIRFAADEERDFVARVGAAARQHAGEAECRELAAAARRYARNKNTFPVAGLDELRELAAAAGLCVVDCHSAASPGEPAADAGPTLRSSAPYAQLVAARPGGTGPGTSSGADTGSRPALRT